ncbi:MAG: hypothetical protein BWK79_14080 [Beggiatoa sp. IS2]|nr:MAG: hypothetical protein BWK79_14080 [Beggiatoa sp. IS2]
MTRIKLIVTGDMEKQALHKSLQRFFPDQLNGEKVEWDQPRKVHCATSHRLLPNSEPSNPMQELAKAMIAEASSGKKSEPADLVIVIDDVELGNLGQEDIIAKHFRTAVKQALEKEKYSSDTEDRYRKILREKCSFHVLRPMAESYFFGDSNALLVAGVPTGVTPKLVHPTDVEQFETNDPNWLPICRTENAKRQQLTSWWHHERHPKHYLEHLTDRGQVFYDETTYGKKALEGIKWEQVLKCSEDIIFVRSLFEDISDWFGIQNPLGRGETNPDFYPVKSVNRANLLLRNM